MIYLSIGHHEKNPGACFNGFCEFNEAKKWVDLIHHAMPDNESLIVPTGTLPNKIEFINKRKPFAAIELHFNSSVVRDKVSGCETLYYPGNEHGLRLATEIQTAISSNGIRNRGAKEGYYRMNKANGVDMFLRKTKCTSVIIEPEFIFNKETIITKREDICKSIAETLKEALVWLAEKKTTT